MGNENDKQPQGQPMPVQAPPVRPIELKTFVMSCQAKIQLYRSKKLYEIKKKKDEAIMSLKQNNLDVARAKMESIIRLEDLITVYDILCPLFEILKERITYLSTSTEVPPDIKAQLDTIIYASSRIEVDDLYTLRNLIGRKFGSYYIEAADQNRDGLVNINVVEKLRVKPPVEAFLTIRLKQLCKEKKFNYEFPEEISPDFSGMSGMDMNANPYNINMGSNPYVGVNPMGNNPYSIQNNDINNPYSQQGGSGGFGNNDFDKYMSGGNPNNSMPNPSPNNLFGNQPPMGGNPYQAGQPPSGGNPYDMGNPGDQPPSGGNPYDMGNQGGGNPYA